jgi:hypothetical protein
VDGACVPAEDPCAHVACDAGSRCSGGQCVCDEASCPKPYICKDGRCSQRTCDDGCPTPYYVCIGGYCEERAKCAADEWYVASTNTCVPMQECDEDMGWVRNPDTGQCEYKGREGVKDITFYSPVEINKNWAQSCPGGYETFAHNLSLGGMSPIYGCKQYGRFTDTGLIGLETSTRGTGYTTVNCPAGYTEDSGHDLNADEGGAYVFACKKTGTVAIPQYIRDVDVIESSDKSATCEAAYGAGWKTVAGDLNHGVPGKYAYFCIKR